MGRRQAIAFAIWLSLCFTSAWLSCATAREEHADVGMAVVAGLALLALVGSMRLVRRSDETSMVYVVTLNVLVAAAAFVTMCAARHV